MNKSIQNQHGNTKNLLELVQKNPELKILPLTNTDCVPSDDYCSWVSEFGNAEINYIWFKPDAERIYIKTHDFKDLVGELISDTGITEEKAKELVNGYEWEKVILVNIVPPSS